MENLRTQTKGNDAELHWQRDRKRMRHRCDECSRALTAASATWHRIADAEEFEHHSLNCCRVGQLVRCRANNRARPPRSVRRRPPTLTTHLRVRFLQQTLKMQLNMKLRR